MSQIQATASSGSSKQAKVRATWRTFEGWLAQGKRTLTTQQSQVDNDATKDYKNLSSVEKAKTSLKQFKTDKRAELEKAFYAKAREEWQDRLRKAGLKDEDWGTMTEAEKKSVEKGLGAHLAAGVEKSSESTTASAAQESASSSSMALVTSSGLLSAPKMFPSVSTSSVSSYASAASYEFVKPSDLGSDDDGDDDPEETFAHATSALGSEDDGELDMLNWRSFDGMPATSSTSSAYAHHVPMYQQQQYTASRPAIATHNTWSSSAESSRHTSASGSPTTSSSGLRNFPNLTSPGTFQAMLSPNIAQPEPYSHSRLFDPAYTSASSVAAGSASASSSASARRPKLLHSATTTSNVSVNTNVWTPPGVASPTATLPPAISASASASASAAAAAAGALVKPKSSPSSSISSTASTSTHTSVSTSTSASSYIGPILLEPSDTEDNNLDLDMLTNLKSKPKSKDFDPAKLLSPEEAEQEAVDFERFKFETRITKIIEFHRIAAEREVRLGLEIMKMRLKDSTSSSSTVDSAAGKDAEPSTALVRVSAGAKSTGKAVREEERKKVAEHEEAMRRLQQEKEDERKQIVREERKRRRAALQLRLELGEKPVLALGAERETLNNPTWLDQYDTVQAVFDVPVPNGELEGVFGGGGKRARSATITQSNSSPQPPGPPQAAGGPQEQQQQQQRVQSRVGGGRQSAKPYPRAHSTKPYRPPPSPEVPIARPRPLPASWGQIPFMQEEQEGGQEEDGYEEGEEEGDEYEYEYEWQYDGDPSQAGYPPPHQPPSFHPEQHGQQVYHPQQHQAHSPPQHQQRQGHGQETFMPRMYDNEVDHHSQQHHHQQQHQQNNQFDNGYGAFPSRFGNYGEDVQLEIQRAMEQLTSSTSGGGYNGGGGFGNASSSDLGGGYMSDTLGAYGQGGGGGGRRPGSGSPPSEHGYATDSRYHGHQGGHQASAHSHHMQQHSHQNHNAQQHQQQHGGSMPMSMSNSTSSSASGMSIPMPGGIGTSPLEVSTPRVGSGQTQHQQNPWGSAAANGNGGFGMMSKTPTKNSPLASRGAGGMFGQGGQQQQQEGHHGQQNHGQQQQQGHQQGQPTMLGGWGRKNSVVNTAIDESPVHSPNLNGATSNNNANLSNTNAGSTNPITNGASSLTSGLWGAAKKFSLFGSTPAPSAETSMDSKLPLDEDRGGDDEEEDEEEEEEVTPPPPPPPTKGKKGGKNAAAPPPPAPAPPAQTTTAKGKKGKGSKTAVEKEKLVEKPAPPPPPPAKETKEPAGKKAGGKKGRQAANKKVTTTTRAEPEQQQQQPSAPAKQDEEDEDEMSVPGGLGASTGSLWDSDASASTPKPPAKGVNPSNWGAPPAPTPAASLNAGPGGGGASGLRKQMYQQQMAMQNSASLQDDQDVVKPTGGNVVDEIPASVHESLWAKARVSSATPTVAGGARGAAETPVGKTGWRASANGPSRLGNRSVFDSFEDEGKSFKTSTPAARAKAAASPAVGGGGASKKKMGGGGPAKKVTIEEVSDEEDGVLDNSLPINYQGIMEPKSPDPMSRMPNIPDFVDLNAAAIAAAQSAANSSSSSSSSSAMNNAKSGTGSHMRQPKPSVPGMFNNLFDYGNGNNSQQPGGQQKRNWNDEDGLFSSNPASMMTTPSSTAPTSPEEGMSAEFLKKAQAQLSGKASSSSSAASAARGGVAGKKGMDTGFSTDWEGTVKANKRGGGPSGWGKSLLSGVMSEDEMMAASVPGGFSKPASGPAAGTGGSNAGGSAPPPAMSIWEAGKQKQQAAKANGGGGPTSNGSSGPGGKGVEADDLFARFAKNQQLEAMKRTGGSR